MPNMTISWPRYNVMAILKYVPLSLTITTNTYYNTANGIEGL